jgi:hypothetical protein
MFRILLLSIGFTSLFSGCGQLPIKAEHALYQAAIADAKTAEQNEISTQLTAIHTDTPNLEWTTLANGHKAVKMLTWTNYQGYREKVGEMYSSNRETWLTVAPDVQQTCRAWGFNETTLDRRLEQLMGLPPHNKKTHFVVMWVEPKNIFRPCPDADIADASCAHTFENSSRHPIPTSHRQWIEQLSAKSYDPETGYPWTRLGYTYDWGNPASEVGVSEFVLESGAEVEIEAMISSAEYCQAIQ